MAKYIVVIKDASGNEWDFEKATGIAWERYENDVGKCKFKLPYTDPKTVAALADDSQFLQILIYRSGVLVWQGYVAFLLDTLDGTEVYGLDFKESLKWYRCQYDQEYTSKKIGTEILSPEWDVIAARSSVILGSLITKGTIEDPYTTSTTTPKTIDRHLFEEDYFSLLKEMVALSRSNSPAGAWTQNTVFDITLSETAPTFSFLRDVGTNKEDVVFELDSEIVDIYIPKDFRYIRNDIKGWSIIEGPDAINSTQTDATSISDYYRREISPVFGAITKQSELDEKVKDFLKESKDPTRDAGFAFASGLVPFDGYSMGDNVQVKVKRGRVNLAEYRRVVGMEVIVDNSGGENTKPILQKLRT